MSLYLKEQAMTYAQVATADDVISPVAEGAGIDPDELRGRVVAGGRAGNGGPGSAGDWFLPGGSGRTHQGTEQTIPVPGVGAQRADRWSEDPVGPTLGPPTGRSAGPTAQARHWPPCPLWWV